MPGYGVPMRGEAMGEPWPRSHARGSRDICEFCTPMFMYGISMLDHLSFDEWWDLLA